MVKTKVTVMVKNILDARWGCDDMEEDGVLTEKNVLELINEDIGAFIEESEFKVKIEIFNGGMNES